MSEVQKKAKERRLSAASYSAGVQKSATHLVFGGVLKDQHKQPTNYSLGPVGDLCRSGIMSDSLPGNILQLICVIRSW